MNVLRLKWKSLKRKEEWFNPCLDVSLGAMSHERFWLELINAEYASNREELKVAAIYMIDFKTSSKMTENLLNRGNWKCWIFIDTRCKMPPCIWRITAFKLFLYKSWENDTLALIHFFYPSCMISYFISSYSLKYVLCHHICDWIVTSNHHWKCILHVTHHMLWCSFSSFILYSYSYKPETKENIIIY